MNMNIKDDSRKIKKGDIFIALNKIHDGHDYIIDAINNGASKVIVEKGLYSVDTLVVKDTHKYLVNYLKENYYDLIKDINLIGITGTNGKTTTAYLIYQALNNIGIKAAYIGTIGFYIENEYRNLSNTTPDILEIYELLLECKDKNIEYVVMEASSQGLDMERLSGLQFKYGVFTNLTQDHLDYHKTMDEYLNCKLKLFDMVTDKRFVNVDSEYKDKFINGDTVTYGFGDSLYKIEDYKISLDGSEFIVDGITYKTKLIGLHNLYNLLATIAVINELGFDIDTNLLNAPKGRMDVIKKDNNIIVVDYAHTPDAVSKIISSVKELNPNKIITIIGCGGNRDKIKRPIMASIACELSDYSIFTSDNPRDEKLSDILNDMVQLLDKNNYETIENREKAIIKGIQMLENNDILLVLGKGHENYQLIKNIKYDFDDKEIVLKNI
ncbi:MAG: UDP-N-acetylmuramoyl-L-alanyl-D-glutamate--2,6-diaminopimelate ligase [Firmicutes bacterium]|nr:UDP-N-acetylmuramoyl-L-alanyl-D-glutamate--2,6-diaminopimelate ligase [Bacillota bacterium]